MAARVLLVGPGAAAIRKTLGASAAGLLLEEAAGLEMCVELAHRSAPDVVIVSGGDPCAVEIVESLAETEVTSTLTVLVVDPLEGRRAPVARLLALGARVVPETELAIRHAIDETLATSAWLPGRRVLVADDDPGITWYFADLLRSEACTVDDVLDGRAALDRALSATPDVVVADILMPGLDGVRLIRHLRLDPVLRDVPVVLLSWKDDWLAQAREAGTDAWGYLAKRAEPSDALTCLRSALASRVRFETRMRREGTVRGVLDDTTPHRLLVTAAETRPDCRISVRDGEALHEVQLRGGRPVTATRVSLQGAVVRGAAALGSLLGLRTGKFVATREHGEVDAQMDGPLAAQLAAQVARLRAGGVPELPVAWAPWAEPATMPSAAPVFERVEVTYGRAAGAATASAPAFAPAPAFASAPASAPAYPYAPPFIQAPQPTITLRMVPGPSGVRRVEAAQATAPLPTLRLPQRPSAASPSPAQPERRAWRAPLQALAVVAVAVVGLATGVGLRAYSSVAERGAHASAK